ncbi:hypothetical protein GOEFS_106_00910 [Gordonia effusa NBRC 100432]|uniref:Uncharacterized protein n=2 Tax=Gordonia effusa TaxID=263908 RepID=H0R543_9ACTN|nr:hypothetical protein GOEFS_106_00910 [Gordonia effusa NBRC 100432]
MAAGPAAAADGNTTASLYTASATGACLGKVNVGVGHYPGQAALSLTSNLYGVGPCTVDLTYAFAKRGSNIRKTFVRHIQGPGVWGTSRDVVSPGPAGIYDVTVTTNAPHTAAQLMTIDIAPIS